MPESITYWKGRLADLKVRALTLMGDDDLLNICLLQIEEAEDAIKKCEKSVDNAPRVAYSSLINQ